MPITSSYKQVKMSPLALKKYLLQKHKIVCCALMDLTAGPREGKKELVWKAEHISLVVQK